MALQALLKFKQVGSATTGNDGEALIVTAADGHVEIENSDNDQVETWLIEILYGPPGSSYERIPGSPLPLSSGTTPTPYHDYIPGGVWPIGCYRIRLTVWDSGGGVDVDIRNFCVVVAGSSIVLPPYQKLPDPLPLLGSGEPGEKPDELNFDGQPFGWCGDEDSSHKLLNEALRNMGSYSGPATPADDDKIAFGNSGAVDWADNVKMVRSSGAQDGLDFGVATVPAADERILLQNDTYISGETTGGGVLRKLLGIDASDIVQVGTALAAAAVVTGAIATLAGTTQVNAKLGANSVLDLVSAGSTLGHDTAVDSIDYRAADLTGTHEFYAGTNLVATLDYGSSPRLLFANIGAATTANVIQASINSSLYDLVTVKEDDGSDVATFGDSTLISVTLSGASATLRGDTSAGIVGAAGGVRVSTTGGGDIEVDSDNKIILDFGSEVQCEFKADGTLLAQIDNNGTGSLPRLLWNDSGTYDVPTAKSHIFKVNDSPVAKIDAVGLALSRTGMAVPTYGDLRFEKTPWISCMDNSEVNEARILEVNTSDYMSIGDGNHIERLHYFSVGRHQFYMGTTSVLWLGSTIKAATPSDGYVLTWKTGGEATWQVLPAGSLLQAPSGQADQICYATAGDNLTYAAGVKIGSGANNIEFGATGVATTGHIRGTTTFNIFGKDSETADSPLLRWGSDQLTIGSNVGVDGIDYVVTTGSTHDFIVNATSALVMDGTTASTWAGASGGEVFVRNAGGYAEWLDIGVTGLATLAGADVDASAGAVGTATKAAREDHTHEVQTAAGAATDVYPGQTGGAGAYDTLARSNHTHANYGWAAAVGALTHNTGGAVGSTNEYAHADHVHSCVTASSTAHCDASAGTAGVATNFIRGDHAHQIDVGSPDSLAVGQSAGDGVSDNLARADHSHAVPAGGTVVTIHDSVNSVGSGGAFAHSTHQHAHGSRGGGSLHDLAVAGVSHGFMDSADKTKLNALDSSLYVLLAGRAGGQTIIGGTAASQVLQLQGTAHATPGVVQLLSSNLDLNSNVIVDGANHVVGYDAGEVTLGNTTHGTVIDGAGQISLEVDGADAINLTGGTATLYLTDVQFHSGESAPAIGQAVNTVLGATQEALRLQAQSNSNGGATNPGGDLELAPGYSVDRIGRIELLIPTGASQTDVSRGLTVSTDDVPEGDALSAGDVRLTAWVSATGDLIIETQGAPAGGVGGGITIETAGGLGSTKDLNLVTGDASVVSGDVHVKIGSAGGTSEGSFKVSISASEQVRIDDKGVIGATTALPRLLWSTDDAVYEVATGKGHSFQVNGVVVATFDNLGSAKWSLPYLGEIEGDFNGTAATFVKVGGNYLDVGGQDAAVTSLRLFAGGSALPVVTVSSGSDYILTRLTSIVFDDAVISPTLGHGLTTTAAGTDLTMISQATSFAGAAAGDLIARAGYGSGAGGTSGHFLVQVAGDVTTTYRKMLEIDDVGLHIYEYAATPSVAELAYDHLYFGYKAATEPIITAVASGDANANDLYISGQDCNYGYAPGNLVLRPGNDGGDDGNSVRKAVIVQGWEDDEGGEYNNLVVFDPYFGVELDQIATITRAHQTSSTATGGTMNVRGGAGGVTSGAGGALVLGGGFGGGSAIDGNTQIQVGTYEVFRAFDDAGYAKVKWFSGAGSAQAIISGARDDPEAALAALLTVFDTFGLIDDQTTAS